ncbi:Uncharacterised protein [Bordetella pertussis]|nr:Uncharacterised protein [Bordetella pertussis]
MLPSRANRLRLSSPRSDTLAASCAGGRTRREKRCDNTPLRISRSRPSSRSSGAWRASSCQRSAGDSVNP